ncbi:MAG: class I SAM-dependent methyltransferase family protein [Candidatus Heimdallarchaeota archaeon]|nr:class I SAM-dependent methyltransferase family protein [Candidatus Heimdallarchaeota archaeon]
MQMESLGVKVPFKEAETLRKTLLSVDGIETTLDFMRDENHLIIPLALSEKETKKLLSDTLPNVELELGFFKFTKKEIRMKNLFEAASKHIPPNLHEFIPKAYDLIGDIIIVDIAKEVVEFKQQIGEALYSLFSSTKTVYRKASSVSGQLRIRNLELLAGEEKCEVIHHEHGVTIYVDVCKTYFSPRLGFEHKRIADLVKENDIVVDLFTGVGPFPLHIAHKLNAKIYAIDINQKAVQCLQKSLKSNKLKGTIIPLHGDCRELSTTLPKADRIIMNLPSNSIEYIDVVIHVLKPGGIIHFYNFVQVEEGEEKTVNLLEKELEKFNWKIKEVINFQKVRDSAPREIHACLDARITS